MNPRFFKSLLIASLCSVRAGTLSVQRFCTGQPPTIPGNATLAYVIDVLGVS